MCPIWFLTQCPEGGTSIKGVSTFVNPFYLSWRCFVRLQKSIRILQIVFAMSQFKDRVIAITGAASGMGLATAKKLLSLGAKLSVADINEEELQRAMSTLKPLNSDSMSSGILVTAVDVRSSAQVNAWIEATIGWFGKLDGAANCAGTIGPGVAKYSIRELSDDIWNTVIDVNLNWRLQLPQGTAEGYGSGR
jgi:NAD(P)-dependent dehydrogenase (short-subunit alcohol dehydrogenase family)